ncbi:MAG: phosphoribosylanthranilate isomerase [Anaerolineae bacterium]|nr:phosphoribosylanthranilate isomerase [Anaerolineae bacterium]
MTKVKICGITNVDDARCAVEAGADFLGFILYPKSPRYITPEQIASITLTIRDEFGAQTPRFVGVFVNETVEQVKTAIHAAGLDLAQLHGDERPREVKALFPYAFKALRPQTLEEAETALARFRPVFLQNDDLPQLLVDAYHPQHYGGTGTQADIDIAQWLSRPIRLLLAGGLAPENVAAAIAQAQPWGVDVSSGVEASKGIKDHGRIRAFINAAKNLI